MIVTPAQDHPPTPFTRHSRTVSLDDGAELVVSSARKSISNWPVSLALNSSVATVQIGVCLTRDQLVELRDACTDVLAATEPDA